jgi:hypothetical protein
MGVPGVADEDLERLHWNRGDGRGTIEYRHRPSGIVVSRECPRGVPVRVIDEELRVELQEALQSRGLLPPGAAARP